MRVAVLATGGKDSTLSMHYTLKEGYEVKYLVSMTPQKKIGEYYYVATREK